MTLLQKKGLFILLATLVVKFFSVNTGFFWDSVLLGSRVANFFFDNGFDSWVLPVEMDSGHPPLFGYLLALWWKIAGQSLVASHLFMAPLVFGLLWQLHSFVSFFVKTPKLQILALVLVVADPTLLSQMFLINPDLLQLFFFFLAINALFRQDFKLKALSLALLGLVSYRGMMLCAGILLFDLARQLLVDKKSLKGVLSFKNALPYIIGFAPAAIYVAWRFFVVGWIVTSPLDPEVGAHYQVGGISTIARNLVVVAHRFLDFGRVFLFVFVIVLLIRKNGLSGQKSLLKLTLLFVLSTSAIWLTSIFVNNPLGHRYFIPSYVALGLLVFLLVQQTKWFKLVYTTLLVLLVGGNFWVYPDRIAQGWDSSLAHLSYWPARKQAINYMNENNIAPAITGTFFPNITTNHNVMLDGKNEPFVKFTGEEVFAMYSNVYNLTDEEFDMLERGYTPIKRFKKSRVKIILYQKRQY